MEKAMITFNELKNKKIRTKKELDQWVKPENYTICFYYTNEDREEFFLVYLKNGYALIPFEECDFKHFSYQLNMEEAKMITEQDVPLLENAIMEYECDLSHIENMLRKGKMNSRCFSFSKDELIEMAKKEEGLNDDTLYDICDETPEKEGYQKNEEYYVNIKIPDNQSLGKIMIQTIYGILCIDYQRSFPNHGYEQLDINSIRYITEKDKDYLNHCCKEQKNRIQSLKEAIEKQRIRTLFR